MGRYNIEGNIIRAYFDNDLDDIAIKAFKKLGWKNNFHKKYWYNKNSKANVAFIDKYINDSNLNVSMTLDLNQLIYNNDLDKYQRRNILKSLYESNYTSKERLISLIKQSILLNTQDVSVCIKMKEDLEYLENYDNIHKGYIIKYRKDPSLWVAWNNNYCLNKKQQMIIFDIGERPSDFYFEDYDFDIVKVFFRCVNKASEEIEIIDDNGEVLDIDTSKMKIINKESFSIPYAFGKKLIENIT